jgi:hypothetical protein
VTSDCGCCDATATAVPADVQNRPGLSAVAYRIGTFGSFREAVVERLSRTPELAALSARSGDDYTITVIELWAAVADVLTFYQERIANEAFLRTATLRDSLTRLVRLIGYELHPGAAALTELAFALEAGAKAVIPAGTRVKSVPAEGERAQTYETLATVAADARLNAVHAFPAPRAATPLRRGASGAIVAPDADALAAAGELAPGDRVLLYDKAGVEVLTVDAVRLDDDVPTVDWVSPIAGAGFTAASDGSDPDVGAFKHGRSFRLFGADAPAVVAVAQRRNSTDATTTFLNTARLDYTRTGDGAQVDQLTLDGRPAGLKAGARVVVSDAAAAVPFEITAVSDVKAERKAKTDPATGVTAVETVAVTGAVTRIKLKKLGARDLTALSDDVRTLTVHELAGEALRFWPYEFRETLAERSVHLAGMRAGWSSLDVRGALLDTGDLEPGRHVLLTDERGGAPTPATVIGAALVGARVSFAPTTADPATVRALGLAPDQTTPLTVLVSAELPNKIPLPLRRRELAVTIGALPTQTAILFASATGSVGVQSLANLLQNAIRAALPEAPTFSGARAWAAGNAVVVAPGVPGDRIALGPTADDPETVAQLGLDGGHATFLDGVATAPVPAGAGAVSGTIRLTAGLDAPQEEPISLATLTASSLAAALNDPRWSATAAEGADGRVLVVHAPAVHQPRELLRVDLDLGRPLALDTATAALHGNVAPAGHGETVRDEVLGDGDAALGFQRFAVRKSPVTFTPAPVPGGVRSSLQLLVDGELWDERPTLYGAGRADRVYVTHIDDAGTLTAQFGDGVTGARLPTGRRNVVARYRTGIGAEGRVRAATLTTLLDRPTGVRRVVNPSPADGGVDRESADRAREAAPGTVRTFGRAVALRDFEDSALTAGEVAKAAATWVWTGYGRAIHLTVAGPAGTRFSPAALERLTATLTAERDPNHRLLVEGYTPVPVIIEATVTVDGRHDRAVVLAAARTALLGALSFERRRFAQPVYVSEVFATLQAVEGVLSVDVDRLDLKSTNTVFRGQHGLDPAAGQPQPRLLMLGARPGATRGSVLPAELASVEVPGQDVVLTATGGIP